LKTKKTKIRVSAILVLASIFALLFAACGSAETVTSMTTPDPTPPPLSEEIFTIEGPVNWDQPVMQQKITLTTLDGQEWPVAMQSTIEVKREAWGLTRTVEGKLSVDLLSLNEYESYLASDRSILFISPDIHFFFRLEPSLDLGDDTLRANLRSFVLREDKEWEFPLMDYLFTLDDASYRQEVVNLAQQVLDIALTEDESGEPSAPEIGMAIGGPGVSGARQVTVTTAGVDQEWDVLYLIESVGAELMELHLLEEIEAGTRRIIVYFDPDSYTVVSIGFVLLNPCGEEEHIDSLLCYLDILSAFGRGIEFQQILDQILAHEGRSGR